MPEVTNPEQIVRDLLTNEAELAKAGEAYLDTPTREAIERILPDRDLCTIAFQAEAYDSAARFIGYMHGWTVDVVPAEGEPFTASVGDLVYPADGGTSVELKVWKDGEPTDEIRELNVYDDIVRMEVC